MKITENKLRDIIRQEIAELSGAAAQKSVSKKKNPKDIKDPHKSQSGIKSGGGKKKTVSAQTRSSIVQGCMDQHGNGGFLYSNCVEKGLRDSLGDSWH